MGNTGKQRLSVPRKPVGLLGSLGKEAPDGTNSFFSFFYFLLS